MSLCEVANLSCHIRADNLKQYAFNLQSTCFGTWHEFSELMRMLVTWAFPCRGPTVRGNLSNAVGYNEAVTTQACLDHALHKHHPGSSSW